MNHSKTVHYEGGFVAKVVVSHPPPTLTVMLRVMSAEVTLRRAESGPSGCRVQACRGSRQYVSCSSTKARKEPILKETRAWSASYDTPLTPAVVHWMAEQSGNSESTVSQQSDRTVR